MDTSYQGIAKDEVHIPPDPVWFLFYGIDRKYLLSVSAVV
jgi:hypothetical protein